MGKIEEAIFAAGCFWGIEETFRKVKGVVDVTSGYTGGHMKNPSYNDVCSTTTGNAESVLVEFDPKQVSYENLLDKFWEIHDPTSYHKQGLDIGSQYRSTIFYQNEKQKTLAIKLKNNGYEVIIFGKRDHPESIGTSYHIKGKDTFIVEHSEDANLVIEHIKKNNFSKVAIISQTTMSVSGYKELIENINKIYVNEFEELYLSMKDMDKNFVFVDTICNPTKQRQSDTEDIAKKADIMIVIGGKNSSNSKELASKSEEFGVETYFIQSVDQLQKDWFNNKEHIGVTAGASTPHTLIDEIVIMIRKCVKN